VLSAGVGALATFHFSLKGLGFISPEIMDNVEAFSELGLGFNILRHYTTDPGLVFIQTSGVRYHLNDSLAVKAGYTSWGYEGGPFLGAHLKIGPGQTVVQKSLDLPSGSLSVPYKQIYLAQFYALYWYIFAAGGYFFDDSTYEVGQGTVWSITSSDSENDEMTIDRSLLALQDDGSKWWKVRFYDDEDDMELLYEVKTDPQYRVVKFRFRDSDEGQTGEYELTPEEIESMNPAETQVITEEEYAEWVQGQERIKTPAGTYNTDHLQTTYSDEENQWAYNWWITDQVPGSMVKFKWVDSDDEWYQGELIDITSGNKAELGSTD